MIGVVRDGQAGEVANILTQGELAVEEQAGLYLVRVELGLTTQAVRSSNAFRSSGSTTF